MRSCALLDFKYGRTDSMSWSWHHEEVFLPSALKHVLVSIEEWLHFEAGLAGLVNNSRTNLLKPVLIPKLGSSSSQPTSLSPWLLWWLIIPFSVSSTKSHSWALNKKRFLLKLSFGHWISKMSCLCWLCLSWKPCLCYILILTLWGWLSCCCSPHSTDEETKV